MLHGLEKNVMFWLAIWIGIGVAYFTYMALHSWRRRSGSEDRDEF